MPRRSMSRLLHPAGLAAISVLLAACGVTAFQGDRSWGAGISDTEGHSSVINVTDHSGRVEDVDFEAAVARAGPGAAPVPGEPSPQDAAFSQDLGSATPEAGYRTLDEMGDDIARSRPLEASALAFRGSFAAREGSFDEARRLTGLAIEISEALGTKGFVAVHEQWLGGVELLADDPVAAERAFRRSYEIHDEIDNEGNKSTASAFLALALCALGRFDEAELFAATARSVAAEDDLASQVVGRSAMALVLASRDAFDEAERLAREAVQMYEEAECPEGQGDATMTLAEVLRAADKISDAERAAREALAFYQRKGNTPAAQAARTFLDHFRQALAGPNHPNRGETALPSRGGPGAHRSHHFEGLEHHDLGAAQQDRAGLRRTSPPGRASRPRSPSSRSPSPWRRPSSGPAEIVFESA